MEPVDDGSSRLMPRDKFTCIIPFYNEGERILNVVREVYSVPAISQIICVDDGSTDGAGQVLKKRFPNVLLLRHHRNLGKTPAVLTGLRRASHEQILLMDGDLIGMRPEHLSQTLATFSERTSLDLLIINNRGMSPLLETLFRIDVLFSGKRILTRSALRAATRSTSEGYLLEAAINYYMMTHQKTVAWIDDHTLNPNKSSKVGFSRGVFLDFKMHWAYFKYLGPRTYLTQALFFCRTKLT